MVCPQCGLQREVLQGPCPRCHFTGQQLIDFPMNTRVCQGRYGLQERGIQRTWVVGIQETFWIGCDFQDQGERVLLYDLAFSPDYAPLLQETLRPTISALLAASNHPALPTLKGVYDEPGHLFFVFPFVRTESLHARLSRLGWPLSEQDALQMCVDVSRALEVLALQSPPLVHGWISPEHISCATGAPGVPHFLLSNCSPLIARGDLRFLKGLTAGGNSPYHAPEFSRGMIDRRSDLYALLATVYYAVTGIIPSSRGAIPPAQQFNSALSPEFTAILNKGLHPDPHQRYQHPADVRQEASALLHKRPLVQPEAKRSLAPSLFTSPTQADQFKRRENGDKAPVSSPLAHPFPIRPGPLEPATLLPSAEALLPMRHGNDRLEAIALFVVVVLGFSLTTALNAFHF